MKDLIQTLKKEGLIITDVKTINSLVEKRISQLNKVNLTVKECLEVLDVSRSTFDRLTKHPNTKLRVVKKGSGKKGDGRIFLALSVREEKKRINKI